MEIFTEIGRRECPGELHLVYEANESGNHIVRNAYADGKKLPGLCFHLIVNPATARKEFEKIMDEDREDFLRKYLRPKTP